jgi:hypothetical protein
MIPDASPVSVADEKTETYHFEDYEVEPGFLAEGIRI